MHVDVVNKFNLWIVLQRELIFRASVAEPWRIITAILTRDLEKDLHIKGQAESATWKRENDLKENRPEKFQGRHYYPNLPHLVPTKAERPPAGQAEVLKNHNDRILLQAKMLNPSIFGGVAARLGRPDIDLFASRVNHQIPEFVSWRPEPNAVATDAFNLTWNYLLSYLFPPFSPIPLCLKKIQRDQAECILIAPVWNSRP